MWKDAGILRWIALSKSWGRFVAPKSLHQHLYSYDLDIFYSQFTHYDDHAVGIGDEAVPQRHELGFHHGCRFMIMLVA